ncbi:hypothetical protein NicSoilB11_41470 (plasmid) [Arthrobacter sp. NicSoilB11]|jgi:hypothetical protein|nr:hypothetical protein NicSoilB11_41470 [Arthrobacter sp. NicSoilB11]GIU57940.1 hypothetical protein NicSoilC12_36890 [Arthrobacter sp. NicSoilC12]VXB94310.1 hypothetical protein ARTHRO8AJ_40103 [Arthrobacter sp. 8AJ]
MDCQPPPSGLKGLLPKKRDQGKKPNAAVICLAPRCCDVIYSMLRNGALYEEKPPQAADEKHRDTPRMLRQNAAIEWKVPPKGTSAI